MSRTSRRQFAKSIAVATAVVPLASVDLLAQAPAEKAPSALAKAFTESVRAQYGAHLTGDDLEQIEKDFNDYIPALERLRQFELANADEPDFTFASLVDRW